MTFITVWRCKNYWCVKN